MNQRLIATCIGASLGVLAIAAITSIGLTVATNLTGETVTAITLAVIGILIVVAIILFARSGVRRYRDGVRHAVDDDRDQMPHSGHPTDVNAKTPQDDGPGDRGKLFSPGMESVYLIAAAGSAVLAVALPNFASALPEAVTPAMVALVFWSLAVIYILLFCVSRYRRRSPRS